MIKRLNNFPSDLESDSGFLRVMSPCFLYYIDLDRQENRFVIRDTITQKIEHTIERYLMDPSGGSIKSKMNKFMWIDSQTIRVVNREGIEKLIDLGNGQAEL